MAPKWVSGPVLEPIVIEVADKYGTFFRKVECMYCGKKFDIRDTFFLMGIPYCANDVEKVAKLRRE